ncbi:MAG: phage Gp37/Gp68 family protein [Clostridiales bacterium]|nr:phage Gp37/Gp68 family protein [Clostridiales bacterium]
MERQIPLFEEPAPDPRPPETVTWNLWHGCTKVSPGCAHCYMFRRDEGVGRDPRVVSKTQAFDLPVRILRAGEFRGRYRIPAGSHFYTCFSSDFFHADADGWRPAAWDMIRERADCSFFMITKRPERIGDHLPPDWGEGWAHVTVAVTCENQAMAEKRLPVYLALPLKHRAVMIEPMLSAVDLRSNGIARIESVSVGGESGPDARPCDFAWVLDVREQCAENGVAFSYHQTGARLVKDGREYRIPRAKQHEQARRANLDLGGTDRLGEIPGE